MSYAFCPDKDPSFLPSCLPLLPLHHAIILLLLTGSVCLQIIPLIPIGLPEYDGGERFDLRLPYVDNGWVDEEADMGKQIGRFFGFGKKEKKDDDDAGKGGKKR